MQKIKVKKEDIENILEVLFMIAILMIAVKKGGFFVYDMDVASLIILIISSAICIFRVIKNEFNPNISCIFLALLGICYLLPVIFKKAVSVEDGVWEAIKYLDLFAVFTLISTSKFRKKYEYFIIFIGVVILIFGIDGIANRYLQKTLNFFSSGYLSTYLDRLSSFIQYANTCAILLCVSLLFSLKLLFKYIDNIKSDYTVKNVRESKYMYVISSILMLGVLLTQSRFPLILALLGIILFIFKSKKNRISKVIVVLTQIFSAAAASNIIYTFIHNEQLYIYLTFLVYISVLVILYSIILSKVIMNVKIWYLEDSSKKNTLLIFFFVLSIAAIYIILAFNIKSGLSISANGKGLDTIRMFDIDKSSHLQEIEACVSKKAENAKYTISIYEQKADNKEVLVARFDDFSLGMRKT